MTLRTPWTIRHDSRHPANGSATVNVLNRKLPPGRSAAALSHHDKFMIYKPPGAYVLRPIELGFQQAEEEEVVKEEEKETLSKLKTQISKQTQTRARKGRLEIFTRFIFSSFCRS